MYIHALNEYNTLHMCDTDSYKKWVINTPYIFYTKAQTKRIGRYCSGKGGKKQRLIPG